MGKEADEADHMRMVRINVENERCRRLRQVRSMTFRRHCVNPPSGVVA